MRRRAPLIVSLTAVALAFVYCWLLACAVLR